MKELSENLHRMLGARGWIESSDSFPWQRDWLNKYGIPPLGVARPRTTSEVSQVVSTCLKHNIPLIPQGGNTSLMGGSVLDAQEGVIVSLSRMNKIELLDLDSGNVIVEAGVILENLHRATNGTSLMLPINLGSAGSAQIGGLIATNAGGSNAFRYGMMQDLVLGLEVVLADGRIWNGLRSVQKDNAGYQLKKIFSGSEGTLGIITRASLKLVQEPKNKVTALMAFKDVTSMMKLVKKLREDSEDFLCAMEFFSDVGLEMMLSNISGLRFPLETRAAYYVLVELGSSSNYVPFNTILEDITAWGIDEGIIVDGAIAMTESQRLHFWRLRDEQPEGQRMNGRQLKHDISVPPGKIGTFLELARQACDGIFNGLMINSFGHLGDGNVHYNISPSSSENDFDGCESILSEKIYRIAEELGGSFAAEHGIGRTKVALADSLRSSVERDLMVSLAAAFDSKNNLNPGVIIASDKLI